MEACVSGRVGHRKRLFCVSAEDLRRGVIRLDGNLDFFPAESFSSRGAGRSAARPLTLHVDGLDQPVRTAIPLDPRTHRPRPYFQSRRWIRDFFERRAIKPGDTIAIEVVSDGHYRISPFDAKSQREHTSEVSLQLTDARSGPTVIELFAGAGGTALGFRQAGFVTVLANEWDRSACDTLRANITDRVLNCAIQEIDQFPAADVVAGGPPCQGFSNLGERVPNDPRNQLWRQYMRCVEQARPKIFVLENVPPLLKSAEYLELCEIAKGLGYRVTGKVLNSADYGVPQTRKRAIVIGSRIGEPEFPAPTHVDPKKRSLLTWNLPAWRTVRDAIGHVPLDPTGVNWHIGRNPTSKSLARYRSIPPGGNRWDLPRRLMPECWKRKTKGGTDLMGRLWWDRPSVTIRTEFYKPEKGRYLHPQADRPITHLEALLLQSFPENYRFLGTRISVGIQIGNAVPPGLATAIANQVATSLAVRRTSAVCSG